MNGYIKLYRQLTLWEWYKDPNTKAVFLHLLLMANHTPGKWRGIDIDRGQHITSIQKLAEETGLSVKNVRTAINHLKATNEVAIKTANKWTLITIENYDKYQSDDSEDGKVNGKISGKEVAKRWQSSGKEVATNKKDKKNKNKKNDKKLERDKREIEKDLSGNDFLVAHSRDRLPEETITEKEFSEMRDDCHNRYIARLKELGYPLPPKVRA